MTNPGLQSILALHDEYVRLTGFKVSILGREHAWYEWVRRELGVPELRLLIAEKRRRIKAGELQSVSLTFRNLVANVDYAEEDIAELRARRRSSAGVPQGDKASLLRQTGRSVSPSPSGRGQGEGERTAAQIVTKLTTDPTAAARALAEFRAMKDRL